MTPERIVGIIILVLGIVLLVMGLNGSNSMADQVNRTFTGHNTDHTTWYIIGGIVLAIVGAIASLGGFWHGRHGPQT